MAIKIITMNNKLRTVFVIHQRLQNHFKILFKSVLNFKKYIHTFAALKRIYITYCNGRTVIQNHISQ